MNMFSERDLQQAIYDSDVHTATDEVKYDNYLEMMQYEE